MNNEIGDNNRKWISVEKALDITSDLGNFLGEIVGPAAIQLGGLLGDQMKYWRLRNLQRISDKWNEIQHLQDSKDINTKILSFQKAILILDGASQEEDDNVQDMWAKLILHATLGKGKPSVEKMHIDFIKSINGIEALCLEIIFLRNDLVWAGRDPEKYVFINEKIELAFNKMLKVALVDFDGDFEIIRNSLFNLQRIGLISPDMTEVRILGYSTYEEWRKSINEENFVERINETIESIVFSLTTFSGDPMNDMRLDQDGARQMLFEDFYMTRLGWSLHSALGYGEL